jgi:hypothetical protein
VFADARTEQIIAIAHDKGKVHDYNIFKDNRAWLPKKAVLIVDTGFLGITNHFTNAIIPHKGSKLHKLTKQQKQENKQISSIRVSIEHINARLKVFKILSSPYRNRRKRFGIRTTLIAAMVNKNIR